MHKKLLLSLVSLPAIVAFAMVPAAAHADSPPHWFLGTPGGSNRLGESGIPATIPTISWGTLLFATGNLPFHPCVALGVPTQE